MRLNMTKMMKNPNIIVGHFICQSAAFYSEIARKSARKRMISAAGDLKAVLAPMDSGHGV